MIDFTEFVSKIRIGFKNYTINFTDDDKPFTSQSNLYGYMSPHTREINVLLRPDDLMGTMNTLFHEITHAIHIDMNLTDESTEEEFTEFGTNGMCAFWLANFDFKMWFDEEINKIIMEMNNIEEVTVLHQGELSLEH